MKAKLIGIDDKIPVRDQAEADRRRAEEELVGEEEYDEVVEMEPIFYDVVRQFRSDGVAVGPDETEVETIVVQDFHVPPARVEVGCGMTLNLGAYETARVDVRISVPCYREEAEEAYKYGLKFVQERVKEETKQLRAWARKRGVNVR